MLPIKDNNPTTITPWVTWTLIALNIVVFIATVTLGPHGSFRVSLQYGAIPAVLFGHVDMPPQLAVFPGGMEFFSIFTAMFLHGGWMHLGGNMLYLWVFGNNVEDAMGHLRFLVFYLLCGVAAAVGHALADTTSQIPMIGASGALAGVLGAYFLLYPKARILVWFFWVLVFYVPAVFVLGFWIFMQFVNLGSGADDGIAWLAHIAGFLAGMALIPFFKHRNLPLWQGGPKQHPAFGVWRPGRRGRATNNPPPPWAQAYEQERAARHQKMRQGGFGPWGKTQKPATKPGIGVPKVALLRPQGNDDETAS
ncbi:MAG: rhomboid family intramembrane serine protease [Pseudomonadota bacterium]